MPRILGKNLADKILKYWSKFFPENRLCHCMQIVPTGDNLHEMSKQKIGIDIACKLAPLALGDNLHAVSKPIFWEKYLQFIIC